MCARRELILPGTKRRIIQLTHIPFITSCLFLKKNKHEKQRKNKGKTKEKQKLLLPENSAVEKWIIIQYKIQQWCDDTCAKNDCID